MFTGLAKELLAKAKYEHPKGKLTGLRKGVVDCGSKTLRMLDAQGKRQELSGDPLAEYQSIILQLEGRDADPEKGVEAVAKLQGDARKDALKKMIEIAENFAGSMGQTIDTLMLGSMFQNDQELINDIIGDKKKQYKTTDEGADALFRHEEARGKQGGENFGLNLNSEEHNSITVTGGGTSYYPKQFPKPVTSMANKGDWNAAWQAASKKSEEKFPGDADNYGKDAAVVFQAVLADLLAAEMIGKLLEKAGIKDEKDLSKVVVYKTSGGSNAGFGIQVGNNAWEITLDKSQIKRFSEGVLGKAIAKMKKEGKSAVEMEDSIADLVTDAAKPGLISGKIEAVEPPWTPENYAKRTGVAAGLDAQLGAMQNAQQEQAVSQVSPAQSSRQKIKSIEQKAKESGDYSDPVQMIEAGKRGRGELPSNTTRRP